MKTLTAIYDAFDMVVVPFPFTDRQATKRRPALVLSRSSSFGAPARHCVLAMVTSRKNDPWPLDTPIMDNPKAGLTAASVVRMKLFTLDSRLIQRKIGSLSDRDRGAVQLALHSLLDLP